MNSIKNREIFISHMENNSLLIMLSGELQPKRGDEFYPFTPKRNFYYMTNIDKPNLVLAIYKDISGKATSSLFIERFDEIKAKWDGSVLSTDEAMELSNIENIDFVDNSKSVITKLIFSKNINSIYMDLENRYTFTNQNEETQYATELLSKFPYLKIKNAYPQFAAQRMIKTNDEIENIRKAIEITKDGILNIMNNLQANLYEYEITAPFEFTLAKNGVTQKAFQTICATGKNACILHYSDNKAIAKDGELILFDLGASYNYYSADITRTFPVNGKFTERQKLLYNIVLSGQEKVINSIKPNVLFSSLNEILKEHYVIELTKIGLIKDESELPKYYYHGVSHMLGLETHDIGRGEEGILREGMVFTVEPGLYISEENIGIRIEDDILVTENGCEILSRGIPKTVKEIESILFIDSGL